MKIRILRKLWNTRKKQIERDLDHKNSISPEVAKFTASKMIKLEKLREK